MDSTIRDGITTAQNSHGRVWKEPDALEYEKTLKPVARLLKKEWTSFGLKNIKASRLPHGLTLRSSFETFQKQTVGFTALLTPGINQEKTINLIIDAAFPVESVLEESLPSFCAFLQQATGLLSPLSLLMDVQGKQIVIRQSQIMSRDYQAITKPIHEAAYLLIPLLQQTISQISIKKPSPGEARQMADYVATSYYGALQQ